MRCAESFLPQRVCYASAAMTYIDYWARALRAEYAREPRLVVPVDLVAEHDDLLPSDGYYIGRRRIGALARAANAVLSYEDRRFYVWELRPEGTELPSGENLRGHPAS